MTSTKFLFSNGVVSYSGDVPPVTTFLENHPGAYTTTRSHNNGACLLFWERHLKRLTQSVRILSNSYPQLLFEATDFSKELSPPLSAISRIWESELQGLVNDSMSKVLPIALKERTEGEELSITALVTGNLEKLSRENGGNSLDVHVYIGAYAPPVFGTRENGAHLAVVGQGREAGPQSTRIGLGQFHRFQVRKSLEKLRPPSATDLLLSNDGDRILEGSVSNFFVVCRKDKVEDKGKCFDEKESTDCFEVQTAPVGENVLPGIIRQLVIDVCLAKGITFREVAPMWSEHEIWEEALITNSLRLLQHVETVSIPDSWDSLDLKSWKEISWNKKQFEGSPGLITRTIQKEVMEKAVLEGYSSGDFV